MSQMRKLEQSCTGGSQQDLNSTVWPQRPQLLITGLIIREQPQGKTETYIRQEGRITLFGDLGKQEKHMEKVTHIC